MDLESRIRKHVALATLAAKKVRLSRLAEDKRTRAITAKDDHVRKFTIDRGVIVVCGRRRWCVTIDFALRVEGQIDCIQYFLR